MQAFLGAINYYSRFIQDIAVYGAVLYQLRKDDFLSEVNLAGARASFAMLQQQIAKIPLLRHFDSTADVHVIVFANKCAMSSTLMKMHDDILHLIRFRGRILKDSEINYHPAVREVLAPLKLLNVTHTLLAGRAIHVYTRFTTIK